MIPQLHAEYEKPVDLAIGQFIKYYQDNKSSIRRGLAKEYINNPSQWFRELIQRFRDRDLKGQEVRYILEFYNRAGVSPTQSLR